MGWDGNLCKHLFHEQCIYEQRSTVLINGTDRRAFLIFRFKQATALVVNFPEILFSSSNQRYFHILANSVASAVALGGLGTGEE